MGNKESAPVGAFVYSVVEDGPKIELFVAPRLALMLAGSEYWGSFASDILWFLEHPLMAEIARIGMCDIYFMMRQMDEISMGRIQVPFSRLVALKRLWEVRINSFVRPDSAAEIFGFKRYRPGNDIVLNEFGQIVGALVLC